MAMLGQSSFRRILLSRVLLLSIPILLLGVAVTFRKARTSLLYTARTNLIESAIKKSQTIETSIQGVRSGLAIASETTALQSDDPARRLAFLNQLVENLPGQINCLRLIDIQSSQVITSTCDTPPTRILQPAWPTQRNARSVDSLQPYRLVVDASGDPNQIDNQSQLNLLLSVPIYDTNNRLRYTLNADFVVKQLENAAPWSLLGYTTVVDQNGIFLAHPSPEYVGRSIANEADQGRFRDVLENALRGASDVRHVNFRGDGQEWLVGFTPIPMSLSPTNSQTWVVMAVTPLDHALKGLESITQILLISTAGLLAAHLLAMLYIARDLSLPIEQLGKYAHRIHKRSPLERAPKNFRIRELNHLSEALDNMVSRLEERAKELESAWQEAEAANQLESEFLANTSHELRTPLNAIIGCIRLVRDGCCDTREEELEFLQQADKAAVHLLKIINDLLDIRRIEEEGLPLCMEVVDLCQILQEVLDLQAVHIQQKGLELNLPDLSNPILIQADPARLKQVLLNVVYNAAKFTDTGGITIGTRIETAVDAGEASSLLNGRRDTAEYPPGSWVVVAVQDTGIGIDPDQQHKLFRPFVMVDGTTTRKFEGTGLGLAISRNLIEMMGGSITLSSEGLDQGTTVEITLPIVDRSQVLTELSVNNSANNPVESSSVAGDRSPINS
ncbi:MAG TPA: sensor histidine kinase [Chroococcidiopsis sp.]